MNQPKAFCPKCKQEVAFENVDGVRQRCPSCGFEYALSPPVYSSAGGPSSGAGELFAFIGRLLLIMAALVVVGLAVAFAGCAILFGKH